MWINEVLSQAEGDPRIQFVELRMREAGQNSVGDARLVIGYQDRPPGARQLPHFAGSVDHRVREPRHRPA